MGIDAPGPLPPRPAPTVVDGPSPPTPGPCPEPPRAAAAPPPAPAPAPPPKGGLLDTLAMVAADVVIHQAVEGVRDQARKVKLEAFVPPAEDIPSAGTLADALSLGSQGLRNQGAWTAAAADEATARTQAAGLPLESGAWRYNAYQLNEWVAQPSEKADSALQQAFVTGHEGALFDALRGRVAETGRRQTMADLLDLALTETKGDVAKALLTTHNTLRAIARPGSEYFAFPQIAGRLDPTVKGIGPDKSAAGEAFMRRHLDGAAVGLRDPLPGEAIADDWYHTFTGAVVAFVATENARASTALTEDLAQGAQLTKPGTWVPAIGTAAQQLVGGATGIDIAGGGMTHAANALAEQVMYGVIQNMRDDPTRPFTRESILGAEPSELLTAARGIALGSHLATRRP